MIGKNSIVIISANIANNIIILVGILLAVIIIGLLFRTDKKENFYSYYKDKQKVGWAAKGESDDGKQPRST